MLLLYFVETTQYIYLVLYFFKDLNLQVLQVEYAVSVLLQQQAPEQQIDKISARQNSAKLH